MKFAPLIKRLRLQRGDVVLIQADTERDRHNALIAIDKLNDQRRAERLPKIQFMVADKSYKFSVISKKKIAR